MALSPEEFKRELEKRNFQLKKDEIKEVNSSDEAKKSGIKITSRGLDNAKTIIIVLLLIIALSFATFAYLAFTDKLDLATITCPEVNVPVTNECPACPAIPELKCEQSCDCPSFPSHLDIEITNSS